MNFIRPIYNWKKIHPCFENPSGILWEDYCFQEISHHPELCNVRAMWWIHRGQGNVQILLNLEHSLLDMNLVKQSNSFGSVELSSIQCCQLAQRCSIHDQHKFCLFVNENNLRRNKTIHERVQIILGNFFSETVAFKRASDVDPICEIHMHSI